MNWKPLAKWGVGLLVIELIFFVVLTTDSIFASGKIQKIQPFPFSKPVPGCPNTKPEDFPQKHITQVGQFRCYGCD